MSETRSHFARCAPAAVASVLSLPFSTRLVLLNIVLYAVAYMMQVPSQPFFISRLMGDAARGAGGVNTAALAFGVFRSYISLLQLVGTIASGFLIDRLGPRALFGLSFGVSALSYGLTAYATTLPLLYASMLPTVLQHAMLGARAFVTQSTPDADRARQMGFLKVAYGVGMVVGPTLGSWLAESQAGVAGTAGAGTASEGAMWLVSITAAAVSALSLLSIVTLMGDPEPPAGVPLVGTAAAAAAAAASAASASSSSKAGAQPAALAGRASQSDYLALLGNGGVAALLALKLLFAAAAALFHGRRALPA